MMIQNSVSQYFKSPSTTVITGRRLVRAVRNHLFGAVSEKASGHTVDGCRDDYGAITSTSVKRKFKVWGGGRIK